MSKKHYCSEGVTLSPFAHIYQTNSLIGLYNSLSMKLAVGTLTALAPILRAINNRESKIRIEPKIFSLLKGQGYVIRDIREADDYLLSKIRMACLGRLNIDNLKMIVTERCNLACKYCVIQGNLGAKERIDMTQQLAEEALQLFAQLTRQAVTAQRIIMLYGGEPLLNWPVCEYIIFRAKEMEAAGNFGGKIALVLETNGTLITPELARILRDNHVLVQVSIDGPACVHDIARKKLNGTGSHADAVRGFEIARKAGCICVVSAVFGNHVASNLKETMDYFINDLRPATIGLDLLHLIEGQSNPMDIPTDDLVPAYIRALDGARKGGLYVEHIVRRIRPFIQENIRWKDCPSCGSRLVIRSDGKVGVCEAFLASGKYYVPRAGEGSGTPELSAIRQWASRTPLVNPECKNCPALTVCGGGCGYNAFVASGDFRNVDTKVCETSKGLLEWAIIEVMALPEISDRALSQGVTMVSRDEKKKILGKIPLEPDTLLTYISKSYELDGR